MTERVHVSIELELFVDDEAALREAAFQRLTEAWSSDEAFPYEKADDVPIDQVTASLIADALPIALPGARRSALSVETESRGTVDDHDASDRDDSDDDQSAGDDTDADESTDDDSEDEG